MAGVSRAVTGPEAAHRIPGYLLKHHIPFPHTAIPGNSPPKVCKPWKCLLNEKVNQSEVRAVACRMLPVIPISQMLLGWRHWTCCNTDTHRRVPNASSPTPQRVPAQPSPL